MDTNKQAPHETYRGKLIADCVAAGMDLAHGLGRGDSLVPAVIAGYMAMRLPQATSRCSRASSMART